jgi:hypothetical protein
LVARTLRSGFLGTLAVAVVSWFAASACSGRSVASNAGTCSNDTDCNAGEVCDFSGGPPRRPALLTPCPYLDCSQGEACPPDFACAPTPNVGSRTTCGSMSCLESCLATGCPQGDVCGANEQCELVPCDSENAPPCPDHWRCDPEASAEQTVSIAGSEIPDAPDPARAISRGCIRSRCDETDGYACRNIFECAPALAQESSGCVPLPCSETGRCADDTRVCAATSPVPPPALPDEFGCVPRHCTQGYECRLDIFLEWGGEFVNVLACDPSDPNATSYGCAPQTCEDEPDWCEPGVTVCEPDDPAANTFGCRKIDANGGTGGASVGQGGSAGASTGGSGDVPAGVCRRQ